MSEDVKNEIVDQSKRIAPFIELNVTFKVFGRVIWSWTFPPKK